MASDPDYCKCGATIRLHGADSTAPFMTVYHPRKSLIAAHVEHRHEWQTARTTAPRHAYSFTAPALSVPSDGTPIEIEPNLSSPAWRG